MTFTVDFVSARKEQPNAAVHLWIVTLAMTFIVDCVTARRLDDVAVHRPVRQYKRPQPPMFVSLEHWITKLRSR